MNTDRICQIAAQPMHAWRTARATGVVRFRPQDALAMVLHVPPGSI